ncbi:threonine ammonia-lyase, biosynthetic [Ectothiorhodospiraceae bacterium BW-2]|nr:threonine ammonia-lyase, biosynthetic [Ectothiorhodospiraceae bacterium BW-2]
MFDDYIRKILTARVYDVAQETPLDWAPNLSRRYRNQIWFKREDLQPVFSFKLRGAYNRMVKLTAAQRQPGVITSSAGNHAQGVALSARYLGIDALIVMPQTTPEIKVSAVRRYGARVTLHGSSYNEAFDYALKCAKESGKTYIPPYDDPDVIAGQGTIAMELLRQHQDPLDAIFVPVGGGGLIAGIAVYVKAIRPDIKIIGVEPEDAASLRAALLANERVVLDQVGLFADGVAVKQVGEEPYRIARECVDEVITVTADEICAAIKDVFEDTRSVSEPAGALAVAGMKRYLQQHNLTEQNHIAIISGANMNFDRLRHVAERAELGERREAVLAVTIPEKPGSFRHFCQLLGSRAITEFNYRMADSRQAHIFVGIQLTGAEQELSELLQQLQHNDLPAIDLSDNEAAKLHVRYMVGGRAKVDHERLMRFEFPERPGALLHFLNRTGGHWNISLFHYRNHGAAYGRVLVGMQVPPGDEAAFRDFLEQVGYRWWDEAANPIYGLFLQ